MTGKAHPVSIGAVSQQLGVSPTRIRELTEAGVFTAERTAGGHRRYDLDATRAAWHRHKLAAADLARSSVALPGTPDDLPPLTVQWSGNLVGLQEDLVWRELEPQLGLKSSTLRSIGYYVFTEMLNNAIDHSGGKLARVRIWRSERRLVLEISDDGVGALRRLADGKDLPDLFSAVQDLTKGKQTTDPARHTGEGIFFSSKAVDLFSLASNGLVWTVDNLRADQAVGTSATTTGTTVILEIDPNTNTELTEVFARYTDNRQFTRSSTVVKLFAIGVDFVSRSEAKRLLAGLDQFSHVELDFKDVQAVGQGFVDELFRVWPQAHPGTSLTPTHMGPAVRFMVERGLPPPLPGRGTS